MLALLAGGAWLARPWLLPPLGRMLVADEEPMPADVVVVHAGGWSGHRILKAGELVRGGFAPRVLVSGPGPFYGLNEGDLAIDYAVSRGFPRAWFQTVPNTADSTLEETRVLWRELERAGFRRFLVVTSSYHTARAARVWRETASGAEFRVLAAPDPLYDPARWWTWRPSRKIWLVEFTKTVADRLGI